MQTLLAICIGQNVTESTEKLPRFQRKDARFLSKITIFAWYTEFDKIIRAFHTCEGL